MQTRRAIAVGVAAGVVATLVMWRGGGQSSQLVAAQARQAATTEVPKFEVDPNWAKSPNGWVLGQVASAAADGRDNIWILHRPRVVRPGLKTGPPVMEFDPAGNYIQGWGGNGAGYDWPSSEHGIYVDYMG